MTQREETLEQQPGQCRACGCTELRPCALEFIEDGEAAARCLQLGRCSPSLAEREGPRRCGFPVRVVPRGPSYSGSAVSCCGTAACGSARR